MNGDNLLYEMSNMSETHREPFIKKICCGLSTKMVALIMGKFPSTLAPFLTRVYGKI